MILLASAVPVAADPFSIPPPPWAVESPAAAGGRFGLGLDYLFEHQESLRIESQESVVSLPTEDGGILTDVVVGDPDLLNRKFDLEWELKGPGVQVPLALPRFRLTDLIEVFPTLTLEAASVDVTLDSISKTESNPRTTLQGRGALFGVKLGTTASLCGPCQWFNGTTYHYRSLPAFEADRSPAFAEPGFEVLHDEVRLSQEVHEVSTKFGYIAPNQRVAYYTGVRARWTDVEIEDELRLVNGEVRQETGLSSSTKLKSETVEAVVGVDTKLGDRVFARTETAFSGQDYGVQVTVAYTPRAKGRRTNRLDEISAAISPDLKRIAAEFALRWSQLKVVEGPQGMPAYHVSELQALLDEIEQQLIAVLSRYSEFEALADWVRDSFGEARQALGLTWGVAGIKEVFSVASIGMFQLSGSMLASQSGASVERRKGEGILSALWDWLIGPLGSGGPYKVEITYNIELDPLDPDDKLDPGAQIFIFPRHKRSSTHSETLAHGGKKEMPWGAYSFEIGSDTNPRPACNAATYSPKDAPCPIRLGGKYSYSKLTCNRRGCTQQ